MKMKTESQAKECPFCGEIPKTTIGMFGISMGTLMERDDGSKYDPRAAQLYSTEFQCSRDCPGNIRIQTESPNPKAFFDGVDRSKSQQQIYDETIARWNTRASRKAEANCK